MIKTYKSKTTSDSVDVSKGYPLLNNSKILIIDDSENNIKVLGNLLKKRNFEVLTAVDAKQGIRIAETKLPDLILLDIIMPEIGGFEACELLKNNKHTRGIPVIFTTGVNETRNIVKGLELGAVDYITKPFNHLELVARIKNHLKLKTTTDHIRALFNSSYHTFITLNKNFEIVNFNNTASEREFFFLKEKLQIGETIFKNITSKDVDFIRKKIEIAYKGKIASFERSYIVEHKKIWFNYVIEPIRDLAGFIIGCIINGTDVTEKKESELRDKEYHKRINEIYNETQQSLSYASYIQKAIFPNNYEISHHFEDNFVFFRPKEKVSGDFFWTCNIDNKSLLVLGDCTGHGVPGALLTTISIVLLERIVKYQHIYCPEKILYELNNNIVSILRQKNSGVRDGLEMAVCLFDNETNTIEFSGAKRSVFIAKNEELIEVKGDRHEIGGVETKKFSKKRLYPEKGSTIYVFSDGITDQIGGEKNKKFMKKKLCKLIQSLNSKPMHIQKKVIEQTIVDWMGNEEQTDDILFIGVRV